MVSDTARDVMPDSGTWFASPARASDAVLRKVAEYCLNNPITQAIMESVEGFVLILNKQRQVLATNQDVLDALNVSDSEYLRGLRPGELFGCIHSNETPNGCGTSRSCSTCGAVISILASQTLKSPTKGECLMTVRRNDVYEAHEFSVRSTPLTLDSNDLTIFLLHDISGAKRRDALESVFIHDLNNIITGLQGWSEILTRRPNDASSIAQKIVGLSSHLTQEVQNQHFLIQAERGELTVKLQTVSISEILEVAHSFFAGYPPDKSQQIDIEIPETEIHIMTSLPLLTRILANMIKNALEATECPAKVKVRYENREGEPCFIVNNPGTIPETVALQLFKRSFSTKSSQGRGLGTYSMKLFGERYLGGAVDFSSHNIDGTSFFIRLPSDTLVTL
ncbi:MAG: HAMP domain-containing sensor histidine kinase [Desulfuromonadaceae bacterium]|nr:HAMP domain-containing sensor histidine kinase [Desulfuromonadaceae bacterium]MDD2854180.1 HAMP domain-containing sensor histidine kinase [Desulfuromonadaceae bacterium]